jgi:hypothetical protein
MHRLFAVLSLSLGLVASGLHAQTLGGTWTLYPQQTQTLQATVSGSINPDGSSVWSTKSTIPVQYDLQQSLGPVVFSSYLAGGTVSYLDFHFAGTVTFDQINLLSAAYQFATGNCHGGSMRWSINLADGDTVYVYFGNAAAPFNDCTSSATSGVNSNPNNQTGLNLLATSFKADPRYEMQSHGGTYVPYATVLTAKTGKIVTSVTLVLDGGWGGDQVLTTGYPMNVTVGTNDGNTAVFVPASSTSTPVCPTQPATIQVSKLGSGGSYTVDESVDSTVPDQGTSFRIAGCKYMYNISGKSLGSGQYKVDAFINGVLLTQPAPGTLFVLK